MTASVVLVPGLGLDARAWRGVRHRLARPSRVVPLPSMGLPGPTGLAGSSAGDVLTVPGAGHMVPLTHPQAVAAALDRLRAPAPRPADAA